MKWLDRLFKPPWDDRYPTGRDETDPHLFYRGLVIAILVSVIIWTVIILLVV
jgi:hypothetical protein